MGRLSCLLVAGALAVVVSVVAAVPAGAAKGGNNDTAKFCQKGTWETLVPDGGGMFANQGDCVNDGAQGNAPFGAAGNAECNEIGGEFQLRAVDRWNCLYTSNSTNTAGMREACATDGGTVTTAQGPGGDTVGICTESP